MEELFADRCCQGLEDILPEGCNKEARIIVQVPGEPTVTYELKNALVAETKPGEIDSEGRQIIGGYHTLSIFGLVKKVDLEP
jgi:hypothetical protein